MESTKHRSEVAPVKRKFNDRDREKFLAVAKVSHPVGPRPIYDAYGLDDEIRNVDRLKQKLSTMKTDKLEERREYTEVVEQVRQAESRIDDLRVFHGPHIGRTVRDLEAWTQRVDDGLLIHEIKKTAAEHRAINNEELAITREYLAAHPIVKTTGRSLVWLQNGECYRLFSTQVQNERVPERESPLRRYPCGDLEDLTITILENEEGVFLIDHDGTLAVLSDNGWVHPSMTTLERRPMSAYFDIQIEDDDVHEFVELRGGMVTPPVLAARAERLRLLREAAEQARLDQQIEDRKAKAKLLREQANALDAEIRDL